MYHVLKSETGMIVHCLVRLVESSTGGKIQVFRRGIPDLKDTIQRMWQIYKDVPDLLLKLLKRDNTHPALVQKTKK